MQVTREWVEKALEETRAARDRARDAMVLNDGAVQAFETVLRRLEEEQE